MKKIVLPAALLTGLAAILFSSGCTTLESGVVGGALGGIIGNQSGRAAEGAAIGAGAGIILNEIDRARGE